MTNKFRMKIINKGLNQKISELYIILNEMEIAELNEKFKQLLEQPNNNNIKIMGEDLHGNLTKEINIKIHD